MEIPQKLLNIDSISYPKAPHHLDTPSCYTTCTSSNLNHRSTSNPTLQIRLPPTRSKRNEVRPIKPPQKTYSDSTTTSDVLRLMDILCLPIPVDIYSLLIKECIRIRDSSRALEIEHHINKRSIHPSLSLLNRLLLMYVSIDCVTNARQLFDKMPSKDCNTWAAMVAGYADNDDYGEVMDLFVEFLRKRSNDSNEVIGFPVSWILVCVLKACSHTLNLELGRQIHGWLLKGGYWGDLFISSSLIKLYRKNGCSDGADMVFDHSSHHNVVVWTARMVNKCEEECFDQVLKVFKEMGNQGVRKNSFTFSSVLRACARMSDDVHCGEQVHANAIKLGLASKSYVQCGLVNMYGKFGFIGDAEKVFEMNGSKRNNACWNAMLANYIQHGFCIKSLTILYQMKAAGVQPHELLLNEVRCVCGSEIL